MFFELIQRTGPRRAGGRLVRAFAIGALIVGAGVTGGSAAEDPDRPGLPLYPTGGTGWNSPRATSLNYVESAKQWVRLPPLFAAALAFPAGTSNDFSCGRLFPYQSTITYDVKIHLRSSDVAPARYGYVGPFSVRTVAFGNVPVEAGVEVRQPRDSENLPIGMDFQQTAKQFCPGKGPNAGPGEVETYSAGARVEGELTVAVSWLKVDGVDVNLRGDCKTATPGKVSLSSPELYGLDPSVRPEDLPTEGNLYTAKYFAPTVGGLLTGVVDIPKFGGCVTNSGEDVSRLVTATVSGGGNHIELRSEGVTSFYPDGREPLDPLPIPTSTP